MIPARLASITALVVVGSVALACGGADGGSAYPDPPAETPPPASGSSSGFADGSDGGAGTDAGAGCATPGRLVGVVRDFREFPKGGHPDFQQYMGFGQKRMVLPTLGPDFKPIYNPDPDPATPGFAPSSPPGKHKFVTSPESFAQWYRDIPNVNTSFQHELVLTPGAGGLSTYASTAFFPADGRGFGNQDRPHNYSFTFELHTEFEYRGGEVFSFRGDDDLWTFINGRLVIDLGGLHEPLDATVDLDARATELGLARGGTYSLDVFHAERHTDLSNFRIDTSIAFTNCTPIIR